MVPSDVTNVFGVIGVIGGIEVIGVIQFCKGPPFLPFEIFAALLLSWTLQTDVIDGIGVIGLIQFCKGPPLKKIFFSSNILFS